MSKGLLVSYAGYPYTPSSLFPDNGLANMAACLIQAGYPIKIWDLNTVSTMTRLMPDALRNEMVTLLPHFQAIGIDPEITQRARQVDEQLETHMAEETTQIGEEMIAEIEAGGYDWVGFKLYMGDGLRNSVRIAEMIRQRLPQVKLIAGGPQVDLVEETLFKRSAVFDLLISGEGEQSIVPLAEYVDGNRPLEEVPNALWKENGRLRKSAEKRVMDMNQLPLPCYDEAIYPAMRGDEKIKMITYDESRGCPHRCAFCIHAAKSGTVRRVKTPERMVEELETLRERYDTRLFRLAGSSTPYKTLHRLSELLLQRETDILYSAYGTVHGLDHDLLPTLRDGGLWGLFFGVESGSERILRDSMEKRGNIVAEMKKTLTACLDAGLFVVTSILYPAPGEDEKSTEETLSLLRSVFAGRSPETYSIPVTFSGLFPRSPWFAQREKFGFEISSEEEYLNEVMDYRIKAIMPYALWPKASYKLDGKAQGELAMQAGQFLRTLRSEGFTTMLLDDTALVAKLAGIPIDQALSHLGAIFFGGQIDALQNIVKTVNQRASLQGGPLPKRVAPLPPSTPAETDD